MYGRLLNTIVNIIFLSFMVLLVSFYFLHEAVKENINTINFRTLDAISISGTFTEELYNTLKREVYRYSAGAPYLLTVVYEKKIDTGIYETYYIRDGINGNNLAYFGDYDPTAAADGIALAERMRIVDPGIYPDPMSSSVPAGTMVNIGINTISQTPPYVNYGLISTSSSGKPWTFPMYKGDKISIILEGQEQTLYGKLINAPFIGMNKNFIDVRIVSRRSTIVGRDAKNLVTGYEVIREINASGRDYPILIYSDDDTMGRTYVFSEQYPEPAPAKTSLDYIWPKGYYSRIWEDGGAPGGIPNNILDSGDIVYFYHTVQ